MVNDIDLEKLKYPIGKFKKPDLITSSHLNAWIHDIELLPDRLNDIVLNLTREELEYHYRPDGWTIKQVVHHCADSHMNSFIRFKLALTEDTPTIKPYFQERWAELQDVTDADISDSMNILKGLHSRWTRLLKSLSENEIKKEFLHPETNKTIALGVTISLYAWHSNHHLAHINQALEFRGIFE
jgi:hypothetical protein